MRIKFKSIIVINLIILSMLIGGWHFDLKAKNLENEMSSTTISKSNNRLSDKDFDWGSIEVISEPIQDQNNNIDYSTGPAVAIENDKIYIVWNDKNDTAGSGTDYDIFYRYFDGYNWSDIQVISEPVQGDNINNDISGSPDIAVENGKIYAVWCDYNNTTGAGSDRDIFYRCNLTGKGWEDIQVISEPVQGQNSNIGDSRWPKIAIENNKIHVVWQDNNNSNNADSDNDIFYICNLTTLDWENIQIISEPILGANENTGNSEWPDIAVNNNKIYVVWGDNNDTFGTGTDHDIFYRCNLGSSWENIQVISEPILNNNNNKGASEKVSITVENNKIYIVWQDNNNTNGAGSDTDIFYRCNLSGIDWETIQVISEPIFGNDENIADSEYPVIFVENGNIYVVWQDYNQTNGASDDYDIFFGCNLTGFNWEKIQVISEPVKGNNFNTAYSTFPDIAVNLGKSHVVWQDENNTNGSGTDYDIFYRWIKDPLPLYLGYSGVVPMSGNTSTKFNFTVTYTHLKNKPPIELTVNISGIEYSMLEVDSADTAYINGKDYFFNIKNLDIGTHTCQFYTSDGAFSWSTPVVNMPIVFNTPPYIITEDNLSAFEDVYYEVDYEYEDIDTINVFQPPGYWNFSTNANWLEFNRTIAVLNGTPEDADVSEYWINITINDTMEIDYTNFTLTVINVNDPPIIVTDDIEITYEDEYYEIDYDAFDIDTPENNLIWTVDTNASWLMFESTTAVLNGTPENDDVGEYWVKISVSDSEYMDYSNFTLKVININDPPRIITEDNITAFEDELYEMDYEAEDVDNNPNELTWIITSNAEWLAIDTANAIINGTPTNDDVGEYWVNISVSDNEYLDFTNFTLTVVNTNDPPRIITEDKTNVTVGELYSVNYEAEDIDPPPITLTWLLKTNASNWLTIDKITGWLNGVPTKGDAGIYWINVSVTDNENGLDYHNFTLQVIKLPTKENSPPELSNASMTPLEGDIETEFTFSVHYYDKDGEAPIFIEVVIDNRAYNMNLKAGEDASNGTYEYRIILTKGTHTYYFMASDGLEMDKTDNSTSPEIKKVEKISGETGSWYWIMGIAIVVIIIVLLTFMFIYKKYRAVKIPTVRAELLHTPPEHIAFPGVTPSIEGAKPLPTQPAVSEQLATPTVQAQPTIATHKEIAPVPTLAPTPVTSQYQLPKETLTKEQQLGLLQERFLRGEVSEETYKELKDKLESSSDGGITVTEEELKKQTITEEEQQNRIKPQQE